MADSTTAYLSLPEPDKADHLWRYTPWRRIHPTGTIGEVPESCAPVLSLSTIDGDDAPEGIRIEMANETDIERLTVPSFGSGETAAAFIRALAAGSAAVLNKTINKASAPAAGRADHQRHRATLRARLTPFR